MRDCKVIYSSIRMDHLQPSCRIRSDSRAHTSEPFGTVFHRKAVPSIRNSQRRKFGHTTGNGASVGRAKTPSDTWCTEIRRGPVPTGRCWLFAATSWLRTMEHCAHLPLPTSSWRHFRSWNRPRRPETKDD